MSERIKAELEKLKRMNVNEAKGVIKKQQGYTVYTCPDRVELVPHTPLGDGVNRIQLAKAIEIVLEDICKR